MATHDYVLDNATGANFRSDLNNALAAIVSNNSSSTEPSTKYAYQWWADTNDGVLKIRNSANDGWVTLLQLDGTLTLEDGSASAPALGFRDDLNTGIFSSAADTLDITCGGTTRGSFSSSGLTVTGTCSATTLTGTLSTAAQTNVTSLGTLTGLTLSGDMTFTGDSANIVFDKSDNQLEFADNAKAEFGTGGDLEIFHNGSQSKIIDTQGNELRLNADTIRFRDKDDSDTYANFIHDGAVELYFDNSKKFETLSDGVRITSADDSSGGVRGDFLFQQTDGTTVATFDASASKLKFEDNRKATFGAADDLEIFHDTSHSRIKDTGTGRLVVNSNSFRLNNAADSENMIKADENSAVSLFFDDSQKFFTSSTGVSLANGDLDVNNNNIKFGHCSSTGTDDTLMFGANGDDLEIFHGGNAQFDCNTGNMELRHTGSFSSARSIFLRARVDESSVTAVSDGGVELYFDNSKKLETLTGGVNIIGALTVNGAALATGGGKILQVISTMKTDTFSSTSSSFTDVTGLSVTITPSSSSNKILVMTFVNFAHSSENRTTARVVRVVGSSEFGIGEADSASNRVRSQFIGRHAALNGASNAVPIQILDSPSTTSACTYKFQFAMIDSGTGQINFGQNDSNSSSHARGISTITVMEVSA